MIIALGSNLVPLAAGERRIYTDAMMSRVAERADNCIWIGPPDSRKFSATAINEVYVLLRELTQRHHCKLIDSRGYTRYPYAGGDGLHYVGREGTAIAKSWADSLFQRDILAIM